MTLGNLTVKAKIAYGFGVLAVMVLGVSALSMRALSIEHDNFSSFVSEDNARVSLAVDIRAGAYARVVGAQNLILAPARSDREPDRLAVIQAQEKVSASLAKLKELVNSNGETLEQERRLFSEVERIEAQYAAVTKEVTRLALSDKRDEASSKMNAEGRPLLAALIKAANDYIALPSAHASELASAADASYVTNRNLMLASSVIAVIIAMGLAQALIVSLARALGAEPTKLGEAAKRVATGDLSPVDGAHDAPAGSVLALLGEMQTSLANVVGQVRNASDSIATGSAEIASGNADLSQRTEQQASNLEQTASAMEQMNATVRNNSDTARQATQLATSASAVAEKGGEVVNQVVQTMGDISASSKKIADIIGVIDGIAFQTNILALNAAVEAARAGEQGRGFAVVASEVRNLAQRSAEAAKEIKSLIGASVERVETGAKLVGDAGDTMHEIVSQVRRVSDLIGEISSATIEQTSGIGQVSDAVTKLDQATQQNAALVEESAAAADSLRQQAVKLAEMVNGFKLGRDGGGSTGVRAAQVVRPTEVKSVGKTQPAASAPVHQYAASKVAALKSTVSAPSTLVKPALATPAPAAAVAAHADSSDDWETF